MSTLELVIVLIVLGIAIFALDDLFVNFLIVLNRAFPQRITHEMRDDLARTPQKKIAIMIANWHEADVLEQMIEGNLNTVEYDQVYFFLGVYPNDPATKTVAERLAQRHSRVIVVVNSLAGPTSKGQMMNQCVRAVFKEELIRKFDFDLIMMHDSEDVLHPLSLQIVNSFSREFHFIQIPVFSFNLPWNKLVAATYLDEFSEHHSGEMILRSKLGHAVPSAGTGTALSRELVLDLMENQNGRLLKEDTLTEDYHLGNLTHQLGYLTRFLCFYTVDHGQRNFVATREYFPKNLGTAIRQKTRWCIGIIFQGTRNIGWSGSLWDRYFLWRDRRGLLNTVLLICSIGVLLAYALEFVGAVDPFKVDQTSFFQSLIAFNLFSVIFRVLARMHAVAFVNTKKQALLVPLRWWIANYINAVACIRGWRDFDLASRRGESPKWIKTQHELPAGFGILTPAPWPEPASQQRVQEGPQII